MNLRREVRWLRPIAAIMVIAVVCAGYILNKQRLESPFASRYSVELEFDGIDAVTPGLGAPLTVAGVEVGQIDRAYLDDGRGVLRASVDPDELPAIYADATAALIPNTPLEDMQIRLNPGRDRENELGPGERVRIAATTTAVESDELLRALDADTRTWMRSLIADLGTGTRGRARDLHDVLETLGPTAAQMRRITSLLASRRRTIPKLVHNLRVIAEATAKSDDELRQLVGAGNATLEALAVNEAPLRRSLELLPPTLASARSTLRRIQPLGRSLTRTLDAIDPTLETLPATLRDAPGALRGLVPLPIGELSEFIDAVRPLSRSVRPATRDLATTAPLLKQAFGVIERASNAIAYTAGPGARPYLFWLAWFSHNVNSTFSTGDAHGAILRGYAQFSCSSFEVNPELTALIGTIFGTPGSCPEDGP